jgi:hypothetical protein
LSAAVTLPRHVDICDEGRVNRQKLVNFLLDAQGVSRRLESWAEVHRDGAWASFGARERMILDGGICKDNKACAKDDKKHLATARQVLVTILTRLPESFSNEAGVQEPGAYLVQGATAELICQSSGGAPVEALGSVPDEFSFAIPFRIRGTADALMFPQGDQSGFKAADKASFTFTDDGVADKKTEKIVATIGYPIAFVDTETAYGELIPFVGYNRNSSKLKGQSRSVTADLWRFGALFHYSISTPRSTGHGRMLAITHWFAARPEYLLNEKDDSELAAINFTYTPVVNGRLNDYVHLIRNRPDFISVRPILDLRWNTGTFTDKGARLAGTSQDYTRIGSQVGLAFTSDYGNIPLDLTITDTFMYAVAGSPRTLNQFKAALAIAFHAKRYFGTEISYTHGRREDIADRESVWTIGLTLKY